MRRRVTKTGNDAGLKQKEKHNVSYERNHKENAGRKVSVGLQTASIWKNESKGKAFYNVTLDRRYRNAKGEWEVH